MKNRTDFIRTEHDIVSDDDLMYAYISDTIDRLAFIRDCSNVEILATLLTIALDEAKHKSK